MMVADNAAGATRAYSAIETGKTFANRMLLSRWNVMSQPIETFPPALAAMAAPAASDRKPVTAIMLPSPSLVISVGSVNFLFQSRQNTTAPARQLTERIESSVI